MAFISTSNCSNNRKLLLLYICCISLAAFAAHGNTIFFDYIWEDRNNFLDPSPIQDIRNIPEFFISSAHQGFSVSHTTPYYRPVTISLLGIEYFFFGPSPFWNHLITVVFHAINAIILFLIGRRLFPAATALPALAASLIFAVHPAMTETVSYLGGRGDIYCALFMGSSFLCYLRFRQENQVALLVFSQLLLALALLSKEMALMVPAIIFIYELNSSNRRHLLYALFPTTLAIAYLLVRANVLAVQAWTSTPLFERIYTGIYVCGQYLLTLLAPIQIKSFYDVTVKFSLLQTEILLMLAVIAGYLLMAVVAFIRQQRLLAALLLTVPILMFPISNIPAMILPSPLATRYLYVPAMAFCLAAGSIYSYLMMKITASPAGRSPRVQTVALAVICTILAGITVTNSLKWQNNDSFFAAMLSEAPGQPMSYKLAGNYFGKTGRGAEMARLNQQSYEITKQRQIALAEELLKFGQSDRAAFELQRIMNAESDPRIIQLLSRVRARQQQPR